MATLFFNRSGFTCGGALVVNEGTEETTIKATRPLAPGEAVFSEHPLITVHPVDGVCFEGKPVRDWIMLLQQVEATVIGKTKWATPPEKKPDTGYMDAANHQAGAAPAGYRPYRAPKPNAVTVAKPDRASDGGGVDAELAAAGWRPYRDPRSKA